MNLNTRKLMENKYLTTVLKIFFCILIVSAIFQSQFTGGFASYKSYVDYYDENQDGQSYYQEATEIRQKFTAKGNILSNLKIYFGAISDTEITIKILDETSNVIVSKTINENGFRADEWNTVSMTSDKMERGRTYTIEITGADLSSIVKPVGITSTYTYMMLGSVLQLGIDIVFSVILAALLCYTIFHFRKIYECFVGSEKKSGLLYAIFFSVHTVLLFNPLENIRNEITEFSRIIGAGINAGVDVSKRISNFNHWFLYFAISFVLYFLLANYLKKKEVSENSKAAVELLDHVIVIANVILALRCITFFYNETQETAVFYYSDYIILWIIFLTLGYIVLHLDKKITVEKFEAVIVSGWMLAYPVSIMITRDWASGKVLMGVQVIISCVIMITVKFLRIDWNRKLLSHGMLSGAVFLSLIPFCTSFYIELISILNQHEIFIARVRRYYFLAVVCALIVIAAITFITYKRGKEIRSWKKFSYPAIVFGISCLWCQIPVTGVYNADIFESANSSILISDFLNYGDIPLVQHYGGHMMSGVWEGILYGLLNKDYAGAIFSPYSGYIGTVLAVLFYFLVKELWNEDAAILTVLFFPFYSSISYWGIGLLMCMGAMLYVKKNTYGRAVLFWGLVVWCALYRLDTGFAFAVACIAAMLIYIIAEKNKRAFKQLFLTLIGWGITGVAAWFALCMIKNINPVSRLMEFLNINLSNQNWAYSGIGSTTLMMFAWIYIFIPFAVISCVIYTIFSSKMRANLQKTQWILLLILGFSYLFNFSRALVRHSLVENGMQMLCIWTAYLFIAAFVTSAKNNGKLFVPIFALFIVCNSIFISDQFFNENSITDKAVQRVGTHTDDWTIGYFAENETADGEPVKTYWQEIKENKEVINRVVWDDTLRNTINEYQVMLDALLDKDETFVDFINKSFLYSAVNRRNPVYVSQSPLQLSGEFTQEQYVRQIEGIPLVIMPYDNANINASEELDGIANSYRYYKVAEYIYQHYVPLCTYGNTYALWCLPERYEEMAAKVSDLEKNGGVEIVKDIAGATADEMPIEDAELMADKDGSFHISATGIDPKICELQNVIDLTPYRGRTISVSVAYETNDASYLQLFYIDEENEEYTEEKSVTAELEAQGIAYFDIPITEYTRIRLDIPEESSIKITSFKVDIYKCSLADYGYDGPYLEEDGVTSRYLPGVHYYAIDKLPVIWAEIDKKKSVDNHVIAKVAYENGYYQYNVDPSVIGNYLKVNLEYSGSDQDGNYKDDDETVKAKLKIGTVVNGEFETKYVYDFTVEEGAHDYMFRISNDYYWYIGETNAVMIECEEQLSDINMEVLEGD